jgi:hypothetical protein
VDVKTTAKGDGDNIIVGMKISSPGSELGRPMMDYIYIGSVEKPFIAGHVRIKRVFKSAGLSAGANPDTDLLIGRTVKIQVTQRTYTDKETQELKTGSNVKEYMFA